MTSKSNIELALVILSNAMKGELRRRWGNKNSSIETLRLLKKIVETSKDQKKMWQKKYRRRSDYIENKRWERAIRHEGFLTEYINVQTKYKIVGLHI